MFNPNSIIPEWAQNVNTKVCIDRVPYTNKPPKSDIGGIVNRTKCTESVKQLTPATLTDYITKGYTFTHAVLNGAKTENWVSQQWFISDIDNDRADVAMQSPADCKELLEARGIPYAFIYYTFSDKPEKRKFRVVLLCNQVISNAIEAKQMMDGLQSLFSQADLACAELPRMYYGTNNKDVDWGGGTFDKQLLLDLYQERVYQEPQPTREYKHTERYEGELDLARAYSEFNLLGYIEQTTGRQAKKHGKDYMINPCPICGHNDDFFVDTSNNLFKCHSSANGTGGNIITYLELTRGLDRQSAREYFKYDIMGVDRQAEKQAYIKSRARQTVHAQMGTAATVESEPDIDLMKMPWVHVEWNEKKQKNDVTILPSILAQCFRERMHYIFVKDQAKSEPQRFYYDGGYYKQVSDEEMQGYIKLLIPHEYLKMSQVTEVQRQLYTDVNCFVSQYDINPEHLINFQNGVLNLHTWEIEPHNPDYLCTIQIPCDYVPNAPAPATGYFDRTIKHLSTDNEGVAQLLLQFMGVTISNVYGWRMKKGLFMVGKGDTGKSLMKELLVKLIGEKNVSGADLDEIEKPFGGSRVYNKRLVGSDDMSYASVNELKTYKKLTGGGTIDCEFKGETAFPYKFSGVLWFCMNELPKFGGDKGKHVYDRIVTVRCDNPVKHIDRLLLDKLYTEREYIVCKAIEALKRVLDNDYQYDIPFVCEIENMLYRTDNNSFLRFLEECTEERPEGKKDKCTIKKCYDVYVAWCKDNNNGHSESKANVKKILADEDKGEELKTGGYDYWTKFTLTQEAKNAYQKVYDVWSETTEGQSYNHR